MNDAVGFFALSIALFAMSNKDMIKLRRWHLLSSVLYIVYGILTSAYPVILGAVLYCGIHAWHIYRESKLKL
ncbi:hypothetical protein FUAX_15850 [Fulvitalea axinellae]|uniref:Inner membrane protein n=1 Tax=Fulvitalea axinellae TaxID=1182444 RepID=A0AAU9CMB6_9BACT|nr:hypothetical protein FUAX_15850 [Fulvitalea axinellae]